MSHKQTLETCKSGEDFFDYSIRQAQVSYRQAKGSHVVINTPHGGVVLPLHGHKDLGTGLRHKIIKALIAIGISVIFVVIILNMGIV